MACFTANARRMGSVVGLILLWRNIRVRVPKGMYMYLPKVQDSAVNIVSRNRTEQVKGKATPQSVETRQFTHKSKNSTVENEIISIGENRVTGENISIKVDLANKEEQVEPTLLPERVEMTLKDKEYSFAEKNIGMKVLSGNKLEQGGVTLDLMPVNRAATNQKSEALNVTKNNSNFQEATIEELSVISLESHRELVPQRVVLGTFVFGEKAANLRRLSMFLETASTAGFDILIIGYPVPPFTMPANVKHFEVTWDQLVDRLLDKLFQGGKDLDPEKVKELRNANPYKVCDYKPLLAYLFPEAMPGYQWWGYIDNDVLLGNLSKFFPQSMLHEHDFVSGGSRSAWGPYMMYRNIPLVNELVLKASEYQSLESIFITTRNVFFDEFAQGMPGKNPASMRKILDQHAPGLGLKGYKMDWFTRLRDIDECRKKHKKVVLPPPERCAECVYENQYLMNSRGNQEVFLCHYEGSKATLDQSLEDESKWQQLLSDKKFRVTWQDGFDFLTDTPHPGRKVRWRKRKKGN